MSTALYRRYRPETFADVIGQEHVTEPLMQALRTGRVGHAYLFSGPRGCGKTTSARILARCLNCAQGPTPEPCGTCDSCVALARGGSGTVDVIEIDAASHGGVDDARDLRERASYGPAQSRYKIYIIDEAHMVTPQGFNALLKIVEEPPEHVKFVFATTEPEKVIGTIRSRTHHYPFRLVPPARLQSYMEELCRLEGMQVAPGVLSFVVRAGGGSVRDSLSVLDQLMAGSGDAGLTYESAAALLGFTDAELLDATIEALSAGDAAAVFRAIDRVVETGLDPRRFVEDLLERLRDLIVVQAVQEGAGQVLRHLPEDQIERMRRQSATFGAGALSRAADIVNAGLTEMTGATAPRLQLELIAARILLPGAAGEAGYAARLDRLERRLDVGGVPTSAAGAAAPQPRPAAAPVAPAAPAPAPAAPAPVAAPAPTREPEPATAGPAPVAAAPGEPEAPPPRPAEPDPAPAPEPTRASAAPAPAPVPDAPVARGPGGIDTDALRRSWPDVLEWLSRHKRVTWTFVSQNAQIAEYDGSRVVLSISTVGLADTFRRGAHAEYVRQALIDVLGVDARVEGVPGDGPPATPPEQPAPASRPVRDEAPPVDAPDDPGPASPDGPVAGSGAQPPRAAAPSWSDAPPPGSAPAWASPLEQARAAVAQEAEQEQVRVEHVVDDTAISHDDESIDDLTDVGVPVVERILGGTVISEEQR
ncbi:DNA polymerase III subunit gamma and tau [uncultured Phycicoccus sp.]|uniref:DNA polymerase III subunit gamma and tau n=1 Tax=uncultured Phycicoccus sp. TaxID=661422 RepID=UPI0026190117|nr:DNA polymerase III subunit gamma and tau [uncultured Phycicoccus sp.]